MPQARYWLWLSLVAGLGTVKSQKLIDDFHDAEKIYALNTKELASVSYLSANNRKMLSDKSLDKAKAIYELCKKLGVRIITREHMRYPERLRTACS